MSEQQPDAPGAGPPVKDEAFWRNFLEQGGDTWKGIGRQIFRRMPSDPRCRMCASPFQGPGAPLMRLIGKRQSEANPNWCTSCIDFMSKHHGGAEVDGAMLFADIRGSTALAERMSSGEYSALLNRYFATATERRLQARRIHRQVRRRRARRAVLPAPHR